MVGETAYSKVSTTLPSGVPAFEDGHRKDNMPQVVKKWQVFPGRNKFYCDGRLMMARQTGVFYVTVVLIVGTCTLFFVCDCPYLAREISPAIPAVAAVLFLFVMSALFRTSFSDPGVIPRASPEEAADIEKQIEVPNGSSSPTFRPPPRTKEVVVRLCFKKHTNCFGCCKVSAENAVLFLDFSITVVEGVVCFFSVWSIMGLAGFHTYLTTSNQTTNEDIKGSFSSRRGQDVYNPYSKGSFISNCASVLCSPAPPSLIDRRGVVIADSGPVLRESYGAVKAFHLSRNGLQLNASTASGAVGPTPVIDMKSSHVPYAGPPLHTGRATLPQAANGSYPRDVHYQNSGSHGRGHIPVAVVPPQSRHPSEPSSITKGLLPDSIDHEFGVDAGSQLSLLKQSSV
ncbi:hypothetical protein HPB52_012404 [Rhipicephalus sanguineus]|uniref:protein S-acyltransferase n=1 Tax=Rhipicephalus sanguineus TaxID=34632 RepID=A0A9D4PP36_RHISA|nr:hypothetical protein HPB52_012404 [Rhipicephalus sanguineus]